MQIPVTLMFDGLPGSEALRRVILNQAHALEHFYRRLTSCRVVVARPNRRGALGQLYTVRINLTVPGEELVVNRERREDRAHEDVYAAVHDAFASARRQLEDYVRRRRGRQVPRAQRLVGRVERLSARDGYGFLKMPNGREIYFHEDAVTDGVFDAMNVGDPVHFKVEQGRRGEQVTSVRLLERSAALGTVA